MAIEGPSSPVPPPVEPDQPQDKEKAGKSKKMGSPLSASAIKGAKPTIQIPRAKLGTSKNLGRVDKSGVKQQLAATESTTKGLCEGIKHAVTKGLTELSSEEAEAITGELFGNVANSSTDQKAEFLKGTIEAIKLTKPEALNTVLKAMEEHFPELKDFTNLIANMPPSTGLLRAAQDGQSGGNTAPAA